MKNRVTELMKSWETTDNSERVEIWDVMEIEENGEKIHVFYNVERANEFGWTVSHYEELERAEESFAYSVGIITNEYGKVGEITVDRFEEKKEEKEMKNTATYGMTNVTIEKETHSGNVTSWIVYADTERWGKHQIIAQFGKKEWAENWCKENGVVFENSSAWEMAEKEVNTGFGKIQIGNTMYRRLYIKDGHLYGHSPSWYGFRDITTLIQNCKMTGEKVGKTTDEKEHGRYKNFTVKFGNECTW